MVIHFSPNTMCKIMWKSHGPKTSVSILNKFYKIIILFVSLVIYRQFFFGLLRLIIPHRIREVKKTKKHLDGLSPTYLNPPPLPPLKMDYVFFHHCFIVLFQFFDIIFTLKVQKKKNVKSGLGPKPSLCSPPPHCGLSPSKCTFP